MLWHNTIDIKWCLNPVEINALFCYSKRVFWSVQNIAIAKAAGHTGLHHVIGGLQACPFYPFYKLPMVFSKFNLYTSHIIHHSVYTIYMKSPGGVDLWPLQSTLIFTSTCVHVPVEEPDLHTVHSYWKPESAYTIRHDNLNITINSNSTICISSTSLVPTGPK